MSDQVSFRSFSLWRKEGSSSLEAVLQVTNLQTVTSFEGSHTYLTLFDGEEELAVQLSPSAVEKSFGVNRFDLVRVRVSGSRDKWTVSEFSVVRSGLTGRVESETKDNESARTLVSLSPGPGGRKSGTPVLIDSIRQCEQLLKDPPIRDDHPITKICDLVAKDSGFSVRGRVINKEPIRSFRSGNGQFFSVKIGDGSGIIRGTFFKQAALRCFEQLKEGRVYEFSGGQVESSTRFNTTMVPYEILFRSSCVIRELSDDPMIPRHDNSLSSLSSAFEAPPNSVLDVLAFTAEPPRLLNIALKSGGSKKMLRAKVWDASDRPVDMVAWGERAETLVLNPFSVYLFRGLKVKEFNKERSLLIDALSEILEPIDCPEFRDLLEWIQVHSSRIRALKEEATPPSPVEGPPEEGFRGLGQIIEDSLQYFSRGENVGKKRFYNAVGFLSASSRKISYPSCGVSDCKKKVTEGSGAFYCEKCQCVVEIPRQRFMADIEVVDSQGKLFGRVFGDDNCLALFGTPVADLERELKENEEKFVEILRSNYYREFSMKLMARKDCFDGEDKVGFEITKVAPFDSTQTHPSNLVKTCKSILYLLDRNK